MEVAYAAAALEAAPQAIQVADRFHVCKNLTQATQLLLARCQPEIAAVGSHTEEPVQDGSAQPMISIEQWRPKEPARVKEARLTRRAGREARYKQMMEMQNLGLTTKAIASQLGLSERTVRSWKAAGSFPEARKTAQEAEEFRRVRSLCAQTMAGGRTQWTHPLA